MKNLSFSKTGLTAGFNRVVISLSVIVLMGFSNKVYSQTTIQAKGLTTICQGGSTTLEVLIYDGYYPWTVVYTDGTTQYTVLGYNCNVDPDDGPVQGDAITVSPTTSKTFSLVSITYGGGVPVYDLSGSVTITVNPLPS
jgi:hypothetical protein